MPIDGHSNGHVSSWPVGLMDKASASGAGIPGSRLGRVICLSLRLCARFETPIRANQQSLYTFPVAVAPYTRIIQTGCALLLQPWRVPCLHSQSEAAALHFSVRPATPTDAKRVDGHARHAFLKRMGNKYASPSVPTWLRNSDNSENKSMAQVCK